MTKQQKQQRTVLLLALAGIGLYLATRNNGDGGLTSKSELPLSGDPNAPALEPKNVPELSVLPMVPGPIPYVPHTDPVYNTMPAPYQPPVEVDYYTDGGQKVLYISPYNGELQYAPGYGPGGANYGYDPNGQQAMQ